MVIESSYDNSFLIVGSGGREGAIALHLHAADPTRRIISAPGNVTTGIVGENVDIDPSNINALTDYALDHGIRTTIVGPETPLVAGIVDEFREANDGKPDDEVSYIFGPDYAAAVLEGSKAEAVKFMERYGIPHPDSYIPRDSTDAEAFLTRPENTDFTVVKADGLTGGKGVEVCSTVEQAVAVARAMMDEGLYGSAGHRTVLQRRITGPELSVVSIVSSDGNYDVLPLAQDHKRLLNGDRGPNTGGMGSYAPTDFVTSDMLQDIRAHIIEPTLNGMADRDTPFQGFLYTGLMLTDKGWVVIEYNVRLGDPETQVQLPLLASDLGGVIQACLSHQFRSGQLRYTSGNAVCVTIAAPGYPKNPQVGQEIRGLDAVQDIPGLQVIHAGTTIQDGAVRVNSGRALNVVARGSTLFDAREVAYKAIGPKGVHFDDMQYRTDIGGAPIT